MAPSTQKSWHPFLIGVIIGVVLVGSVASLALIARAHTSAHTAVVVAPTATDLPTTLPPPGDTNLAAPHPIGTDFAAFYQKNNGALWLGQPISPELPDGQSVEQFFESGLLRWGPDTNNQVVTEPLTQQLTNQGAALALVASDGTLTYAALRQVVDTNPLAPAPWWWDATKDPLVAGLFLAQTVQKGVAYGYYIPATFVPMLQKLGNWQTLLGLPIAQGQTATITVRGALHHVVVLPFARGVLWYDRDATGTPAIQRQHIGNDYLAINGWPTLVAPTARPAWTLGAPQAIMSGPANGNVTTTFLTPFTVQLVGDSKWVGHDLWLHIRWVNFQKSRDGWANADQISSARPSNAGMQMATLDALSPAALAAAQNYGSNVTFSIYDPATNHYYVYNPYEQLEMASMFKIPILVTLLHEIEQEGRGLTSDEQADTTSMIEVSDNDAEGRMYDDAGGYDAITSYINAIGIDDMQINTGGIGSTVMSSLSSVRLIEMLRSGKLLNQRDTQYALNLMANVVSYQRAGVCDTAPSGASCSMKIGYGPAINGFLMDAMGTVTYKGHVYDMAIYSDFDNDFGTGAGVVDNVCSQAVAAMF